MSDSTGDLPPLKISLKLPPGKPASQPQRPKNGSTHIARHTASSSTKHRAGTNRPPPGKAMSADDIARAMGLKPMRVDPGPVREESDSSSDESELSIVDDEDTDEESTELSKETSITSPPLPAKSGGSSLTIRFKPPESEQKAGMRKGSDAGGMEGSSSITAGQSDPEDVDIVEIDDDGEDYRHKTGEHPGPNAPRHVWPGVGDKRRISDDEGDNFRKRQKFGANETGVTFRVVRDSSGTLDPEISASSDGGESSNLSVSGRGLSIDVEDETPLSNDGNHVSGRGSRAVRRSRGKGFSRRRKPPGEGGPKGVWKPKKKSLQTILRKMIATLKQKDHYGFFLEPVDTSAVPDYLSVISHPMDLGTMGKKVQRQAYKSCEEFQADFELVISNAKTFNPPDNVYYKAAEKLGDYGLKLIMREGMNVGSDAEVENDELDVVGMPYLRARRKVEPKGGVSKSVPEGKEGRRPKRMKHVEVLEVAMSQRSMPDGTAKRVDPNNPWTLIPESSNIPRGFTDYGPYQLRTPQPRNVPSDSPLFYTYADETGEAYAKSLTRFVADLGPELQSKVDKALDSLTRGAHGICRAVEQAVGASKMSRSAVGSALTPAPSTTAPQVISAELGTVNVTEELEQLRSDDGRVIKEAELEIYRREGVDIVPLLKPACYGIVDTNLSRELATTTLLEVLEGNIKDVTALEKMRTERGLGKEGDTGPTDAEKVTQERIRRRLLHLVQKAPPTEFASAKELPSIEAIYNMVRRPPNAGGQAGGGGLSSVT
ncbi:Bromodomain-containing protein 9 [Borealophlyctis nickersoniae]|nr:Bromodomain-containing protein 9 [Borealophlyctis nickersoniae]